jgi:hypothetical protein
MVAIGGHADTVGDELTVSRFFWRAASSPSCMTRSRRSTLHVVVTPLVSTALMRSASASVGAGCCWLASRIYAITTTQLSMSKIVAVHRQSDRNSYLTR